MGVVWLVTVAGAAAAFAPPFFGLPLAAQVISADGDAEMARVRAELLDANGAVATFIRTWNSGDKDAAAPGQRAVTKGQSCPRK